MKTKIILEAGYNHQGNVEIAKKIIDEASQLGVWAVKFQKWDIEGFPEEIKNKPRSDKHAFGKTYIEHRRALELSIDELLELNEYAEKNCLFFICSAKDLVSLKLLVNAGVTCIKLPSQRLFDQEMIDYIKPIQDDLFILASTGMHYQKEIVDSYWRKNATVLMHCITDYPVNLNDCDIAFMRKIAYNGYSSHEFEGRAIKYAVACGAYFIERHYTLDKTMKGADHIVSSDFKEMERIIEEIKEAEMIMGNGKREMSKDELNNRNFYLGF